MPSQEHDIPAELFRWSPILAAELLTEMGVHLPEVRQARDVSESFTDFNTKEYTADAAIVLETARGRTGVVVEVQRKRADDKRWTWPLYLATLRNRQRCPSILLVIAPDPRVAEWCGTQIDTGHPGHTLTPLVLGADHVPLLKDPEEIAADPAMGVLSALFHGAGAESSEVIRVAVEATNLLGDNRDARRDRYYSFVAGVLPEVARKSLEAMMKTDSPYYSDIQRNAQAKGKAEGKAEVVVAVLEGKGVKLREDERERILTCRDQDQLDVWVRRLAGAETAEDLFA